MFNRNDIVVIKGDKWASPLTVRAISNDERKIYTESVHGNQYSNTPKELRLVEKFNGQSAHILSNSV